MSLCPSSSCTTRRSAPPPNRWLAKQCRRTCGEIAFSSPDTCSTVTAPGVYVVDVAVTFDRQKTFVDGLNIATASLPVAGGAWVMNPPYLLFYRDRSGDGLPDGDPEVRVIVLTGAAVISVIVSAGIVWSLARETATLTNSS